jgi:hypothetical protein
MNLDDYAKEKLWSILVDTVHALTMYPYHKAYTRDNILNGKPDITPEDLANRLGMPLGEAVVILSELGVKEKQIK